MSMKRWLTASSLPIFAAMLVGCCGTITGDLLLASCKEPRRQQGAFIGDSSDMIGNRCETYELRDKSYKTICDRSSPSYQNPSAQPYPTK